MFPSRSNPSESRRAKASRPQRGGNRAVLAPASAGYTQETMYAGYSENSPPPHISTRTSGSAYPDPALAIEAQEPYFMGSTDAPFSQGRASGRSRATDFDDHNFPPLAYSHSYNGIVSHPQMARARESSSYEQPAFGFPGSIPTQGQYPHFSHALAPSRTSGDHWFNPSHSEAQAGQHRSSIDEPWIRQPVEPSVIAGEPYGDGWNFQTIPHNRWLGNMTAMEEPPLPSGQYGYHKVAAVSANQLQRFSQGFVGGRPVSHRAPVRSNEARSAYSEVNCHGPCDNLGYDVDDDEYLDHTTASPYQAPPATQHPSNTNYVALPPVSQAGSSQVKQTTKANNVARPSKRTRASKRAKVGGDTRTHNGRFEHRRNDGMGWQPAVWHRDIFQELLQWAKDRCRYVVPPKRGAAPGDETAPVPGHESWAEARSRRPDILFELERPEGGVQPAIGYAGMFTYNGLRVIDRNKFWMRHWADVPITVSSMIEGWHMEALHRRNPDLEIPDIQARMLDSIPWALPRKHTPLTNRTMRFRWESFNVTWGIWRPGSEDVFNWFKALLPQRCLDENNTRCLKKDLSAEGLRKLQSYLKMTAAQKAAELASLRPDSPPAVHPQAQSGLDSSPHAPVQTTGAGPLTRHRRRARPFDAAVSRPPTGSRTGGQEGGQTGPQKIQPINRRKRRHDGEEDTYHAYPQHRENPEEKQVFDSRDAPRKRLRRNLSSPLNGSSPGRDITPESGHRQHGDSSTGSPSSPGVLEYAPGYLLYNQDDSDFHQGDDDLVEDDENDEDAAQQDQDAVLDDPNLTGDAQEDSFSNSWEQGDAPLYPGRIIADEEQDLVDLVNQTENTPLDLWGPVDANEHRAQQAQDPFTTLRNDFLASMARVRLDVGRTYTIICLDDKVASQGLVRDGMPNGTFKSYPESPEALGLHPQWLRGVQADIGHLMNTSESKATASRKDKHPQRKDGTEQQDRCAYLFVDKTYIIICHHNQDVRKGLAVIGEDTFWEEYTLEAALEDVGNLLAAHEGLDSEEQNLDTSDIGLPPTSEDNEEFEEEPSEDGL